MVKTHQKQTQRLNPNQQSTLRTTHNRCTTVVHNTTQNSYDHFRFFPPDIIIAAMISAEWVGKLSLSRGSMNFSVLF